MSSRRAVFMALLGLGSGCSSPPCGEHADCPVGLLCNFTEGECSLQRCLYDSDCGEHGRCDDCAVGSCPVCADCQRACR